jgi:AraC family transcriptional regulator
MKNGDSIQRSIDYIEEHLTEDIFLDELADLTFFSKYHFHRMFKLESGKTVMEYIRERRLSQATYELAYSSKTINEIAYSFGFHSQDAFDKAFKRIYGISPNEYRKSMILRFSNLTLKEQTRMYDFNILNKTSCSTEDKLKCLQVLDIIITLSKKAHREGLLSLESEVSNHYPFLLQKGLDLLLYGTEPFELRALLDNYIHTGNFTGKELLSRILIKEGIMSIQIGEYPWVVREKLSSFFGEDFSEEINRHFETDSTNKAAKINRLVREIENLKPYSEATSLLENELKKLDKRSMQRVLREVDIVELAIGIKGASGAIQCKIFEGLPRNSVLILIEIYELIGDIKVPEIVDAQSRIIGQIKKLKADGEIG